MLSAAIGRWSRSSMRRLMRGPAVMDLLRSVPDDELDMERGLPWGDGTLRYWIGPRMHHDTEHAAGLAAWRGRLGEAAPAKWPDRGPKVLLLAGLTARREALLAYMALVPPEDRATAVIAGGWTLLQMAGHVADWERLAVVILDGMAAGVEPATDYDSRLPGIQRAARGCAGGATVGHRLDGLQRGACGAT